MLLMHSVPHAEVITAERMTASKIKLEQGRCNMTDLCGFDRWQLPSTSRSTSRTVASVGSRRWAGCHAVCIPAVHVQMQE